MKNHINSLWLTCLFVALSGCAPEADQTNQAEGGGIAVRAIWPSPAEWQSLSTRRWTARSELPVEAKTVRARISAPDMNTMQKDFPAEDHQGVISGVPVGSNRRLTLQALNSTGALLADCEKSGLLIEAGKTTQAGDCVFKVVTNGGGSSTAIEPKMISIPGGSFEMGSPEDEEGRFDDERLHTVTVGDFSMGQYEVTRGEFRVFVDATGYQTDAEKNSGGDDGCYVDKGNSDFGYLVGTSWRDPNYSQTDAHPVVCVSWLDATAYAEWLSKETGKNYRLPTEAEWEYAARAGTSTPYIFGEDSNELCQWGNVADQKAKEVYENFTIADCNDGYVYTAPTGRFKANDLGLYDVHGNVWEWSCSEYVSSYDGSEKECLSKNNASAFRALRGGSWFSGPRGVRSADRGRSGPSGRDGGIGFRLARTN